MFCKVKTHRQSSQTREVKISVRASVNQSLNSRMTLIFPANAFLRRRCSAKTSLLILFLWAAGGSTTKHQGPPSAWHTQPRCSGGAIRGVVGGAPGAWGARSKSGGHAASQVRLLRGDVSLPLLSRCDKHSSCLTWLALHVSQCYAELILLWEISKNTRNLNGRSLRL